MVGFEADAAAAGVAAGADAEGVFGCGAAVAARLRASASSFVRAIFVSSSMCFWKNSSCEEDAFPVATMVMTAFSS